MLRELESELIETTQCVSIYLVTYSPGIISSLGSSETQEVESAENMYMVHLELVVEG